METLYKIKTSSETISLLKTNLGYKVTVEFDNGGILTTKFKDEVEANIFFNEMLTEVSTSEFND